MNLSAREDPGRLRAVLVYEDLQTGMRAHEALNRTINQLAPEPDFELELWRFDLLAEPGMLDNAARDAARSDIVLLAAHGQDHLPKVVESWVQRWVAQKSEAPCALAVSLDPGANADQLTARIQRLLEETAPGKGIQVFLHKAEKPQSDFDYQSLYASPPGNSPGRP